MAQGPLPFSVAIMTHPRRADMCAGLLHMLGVVHAGSSPPITDLSIVRDEQSEGCWPTARRAWELGQSNEPDMWHVVIQDDAMPCDQFLWRAGAALDAVPLGVPVVSFYWTAHTDQEKAEAEHAPVPWVRMRTCQTGVCVAMRSCFIPQWLAWVDHCVLPKCPSYDQRLSMWLWHRYLEAWFTIPSLCDHRGDLSLMGHHMPPRRATFFADVGVQEAFSWRADDREPPIVGRDETPRMTAYQR